MAGTGFPASPCTGVCRMDDARSRCRGCGRTLNEIAEWSRMGVPARRSVLERLRAEGWGDAPGAPADDVSG